VFLNSEVVFGLRAPHSLAQQSALTSIDSTTKNMEGAITDAEESLADIEADSEAALKIRALPLLRERLNAARLWIRDADGEKFESSKSNQWTFGPPVVGYALLKHISDLQTVATTLGLSIDLSQDANVSADQLKIEIDNFTSQKSLADTLVANVKAANKSIVGAKKSLDREKVNDLKKAQTKVEAERLKKVKDAETQLAAELTKAKKARTSGKKEPLWQHDLARHGHPKFCMHDTYQGVQDKLSGKAYADEPFLVKNLWDEVQKVLNEDKKLDSSLVCFRNGFMDSSAAKTRGRCSSNVEDCPALREALVKAAPRQDINASNALMLPLKDTSFFGYLPSYKRHGTENHHSACVRITFVGRRQIIAMHYSDASKVFEMMEATESEKAPTPSVKDLLAYFDTCSSELLCVAAKAGCYLHHATVPVKVASFLCPGMLVWERACGEPVAGLKVSSVCAGPRVSRSLRCLADAANPGKIEVAPDKNSHLTEGTASMQHIEAMATCVQLFVDAVEAARETAPVGLPLPSADQELQSSLEAVPDTFTVTTRAGTDFEDVQIVKVSTDFNVPSVEPAWWQKLNASLRSEIEKHVLKLLGDTVSVEVLKTKLRSKFMLSADKVNDVVEFLSPSFRSSGNLASLEPTWFSNLGGTIKECVIKLAKDMASGKHGLLSEFSLKKFEDELGLEKSSVAELEVFFQACKITSRCFA
jgi:hypothetical protein